MKDLLELALRAACEASVAIMEVYGREFDVELKADQSPLTEADRASHAIIVRRLAAAGLPILSEESAAAPYAERQTWTRFWLVDPVDGTKEFVNRTGEFTVNIALVDDGRPVLGVVLVPVHDLAYWGLAGEGAWRAHAPLGGAAAGLLAAGRPIAVNRAADPAKPLRAVASRSHLNEDTARFLDQLEAVHGAVERVSRGSSLKLCMVAAGEARIYPRIAPTMEWDTGAAQAVVEAAGGRVYEYIPEVAATAYLEPDRHPELQALRYNKSDLLNPFFVVC